MIIIPSIDIRQGKCVRLIQGDFNKSSIYTNTPQNMAKKFNTDGATILHIVDLDGAKNGQLSQIDAITEVAKTFKGNVQVGGGIREQIDIDTLFSSGAKRVVIGTRAIQQNQQTAKWIKEYGSDAIVLALDFKIRSGTPYLAICGWQEETAQNLWQLLDQFDEIQHVLCTDIGKDGMQHGPNFEFYQEFISRYPSIQLQASGGISSLEDIKKLQKLGVSSAIIGKAIYENKIILKEAIECLK
jgi:phosphoribosylformimino-5-aminoimidazole carboxamide ribotide isomerase